MEGRRARSRCIFLCCVAAAAAMSLLYVATLDAWQRPDRESGWRRRLLVSTPGCELPAMELRSAAVAPYLQREPAPPCLGASPAVLSNATHLWTRDRRPDCCLQLLLPRPRSDSAYSVTNGCMPLPASGLRVLDSEGGGPEFVRVSCPGERWQDLHAFVPLTRPAYNCSAADGSCGGETAANDSVNVLMLGLDAVSRLNFHRQMPLTADMLRELDAIEMLGYNKVGDNTFPNMLAALSGHTERELRDSCWDGKAAFNPCPWVWYNYSAAGHRTMFIEDSPYLGMFHFEKPGFSESPTDYYPRPYMRAVDKELGHAGTETTSRCAGERLQVSVLLTYVRKFVEAMGSAGWRYWALGWSTSVTHDRLNGPQLADSELSSFLRWLRDTGALQSTVLMLLSDHGIRAGAFRQTRQGQLEERLPLLAVALPTWFSQRYRAAARNLRRNARRLSTPFDLHRTLLDLVRPDRALLDHQLLRRREREPGRGRSLFTALPESRTCADAGVHVHWCACKRGTRPLAPQSGLARAAAQRFVHQLNARLAPLRAARGGGAGGERLCAQLRLRRVLSALRSPHDVTVTLETAPGGARFEATLALDDAGGGDDGGALGAATLEAVSRVNMYGNQSACISDFHLKLFCYCVS
ncbi:uncharacterized protein LOC124594478 [Schistocerca americana]|uniref:uncharacterized protein LOC124594478 n=1 Tax=Schistocerca americana TaxID=7009 RepID=UPI001F4FF7D9|nr:uncharacterized protein LOC124594478 [Schistocerca americana]